MKFYKLLYDYENGENAIFCNSVDLKGLDRYDVQKGYLVQIRDDEIVLEKDCSEGNDETDYLANDLSWLIVSQKTKKLIEKIESESIQFVKIKIVGKNNVSLSNNYYLANPLSILDALDLENSKYDIFKTSNGVQVISVEKYALKLNKIKNSHIFRLKDETIPVFVSEKIKDLFERNKLAGFDFLEVKIT